MMTKENFIKELQTFKDDCKSLEVEFKPIWKKLKEIRKRAIKLCNETQKNESLYFHDDVFDRDLADGWNEGMFFRLDDICEFIPQSIETIDNCLHNVSVSKVKSKLKSKKTSKKKVCDDCH